ERLATSVLRKVDHLFIVGKNPAAALQSFAEEALDQGVVLPADDLEPGEALHFDRARPLALARFRVQPPKAERRRHERKYASGELGEDKSFYFRGPARSLNLRANNLALFLQLAEGVDDATWAFHLASNDYSRWIRDSIKNDELATAVFSIEAN